VKKSKWSKNFSLGSAGTSGVLRINGYNREVYDLGVEIQRSKGMFQMTNIITFYPRYIFKNLSRYTLKYRQVDT
jgi:hypothetical protein